MVLNIDEERDKQVYSYYSDRSGRMIVVNELSTDIFDALFFIFILKFVGSIPKEKKLIQFF